MFLAWNEIKKNKLRFTLIIGVLMLVSYLVFFLSGLANGLQQMNRESVDKWDSDAIILTDDSDKSLYQSSMDVSEVDEIDTDKIAVIGQMSTIARLDDMKINVSIFGINDDEFLMPNITDGKSFTEINEVIASDTLKDEGFKLGDILKLSSSDDSLTIVGFTSNARFNASPVLYTNLETLNAVKFGDYAEVNKDQINAIVIQSTDLSTIKTNEALEIVDTETFIQNLPGYTEQSLSLNFMIYFLFIISAVIVAIFLYVLTVQKISMFGIMKAQGISNAYLSKSIVAQTFILAAVGVTIGFALTLLTGAFLPSAVPVSFDLVKMLLNGLVLVIVAIAGAVFSVLTIVKIDPLKAIGG